MSNQLNNRYYLMRHGESLANQRGIIVSHPENALHHYGLTTLGAEQVTKRAESTRLDHNTIIISSDYARARDTAEIMSDVLDCAAKVELEPLLRERDFGEFELQDQQYYQTVWKNDLQQPEITHHGVEMVNMVTSRVIKLRAKLEQRFCDRQILLVGHGDVLQMTLAQCHGINPRFHRSLVHIGNAEIRSMVKLNAGVSKLA
ncbi:MAG: broad specificity phosphatase PhoE [Cryomorphaceae bacterium]|jgi:broad specificity phosphatase PhoE